MRVRVALFNIGFIAAAIASGGDARAAAYDTSASARTDRAEVILAQAPQSPVARPPTAAQSAPKGKSCRREPIWGFRMSPFCKPTGICNDRVIKGYRTVCT